METKLINEIKEFCKSKGITCSRLGTLALGTHAFVKRLESGTKPRKTTAEYVRKWMADNRETKFTRGGKIDVPGDQ